MYGHSIGTVRLRGILMAVATLALMLVDLGAAGSVARRDPAPRESQPQGDPGQDRHGLGNEAERQVSHRDGDSVSGKRMLLEQKGAGTAVWVHVPSVLSHELGRRVQPGWLRRLLRVLATEGRQVHTDGPLQAHGQNKTMSGTLRVR